MASSGIKIKLKGWNEYLDLIQAAGRELEPIARECITESAKIVEQELAAAASSAGVPGDLVGDIETEISGNGNAYTASIGWKKGEYNPKKLSNGYKIVFMNYGTGHRQTKLKANRGQMTELGFIQKGRTAANKKIKKKQKEALNAMTKGLQ